MIYKLIKLLGGYSEREYKKLDSHYDVLLSRAEDALEKEKEARRAAQIELERLKEWRNKVAIKLRREGVEEDVNSSLLKN